MEIIRTVEEMRAWTGRCKEAGLRIAFVPTMGALHEGHLALLRDGKKRADKLVLSIYVNPAQFGPNEDYKKYPRDIDGDLKKIGGLGVDAVFFPSDDVIYPKGHCTFVNVDELSKNLCGASRPGHFRGVATVVAKLFNIVQPDVAVFGQKDFQQLVVIRQMVKDLNFPVEIVGRPIVREADGLAMSSRNVHLSPRERDAALSISRSLNVAKALVDRGATDVREILASVRETVQSAGAVRVDYAKMVDAENLRDIAKFKRPALLAIAAFVGKTRLIDNYLFS